MSPPKPPFTTLNTTTHAPSSPPQTTTMAKLFLSLSFLLLIINGCFARDQSCQGSFQSKNECQLRRINALEPNQRFQSEGGFTEFFDSNEQQFKCAGVEVLRHLIQPRGLLLPSYTNTPILFYVEQGTLHIALCKKVYDRVLQLQIVIGKLCIEMWVRPRT